MAGVQTSYSDKAVTGRAGQLADNAEDKLIEAAHASGTPRVGNAVLLTGPKAGDLDKAQAAVLSALTVSATAILASTAAAVTAETINGASTPALNTARLSPARRITAVLNSHANWDATRMRVYGEDWQGNPIREELLIPDAGAATLTTQQFFSRVTSVEVDAQSGAAATFTMGYTADEGIYHPDAIGVLVRNTVSEPLDANDAVADKDRVDVLRRGHIFVTVEAAVTARGTPAYLRTATSGGNVIGQWSSTGGAGFTPQPWASFDKTSDSSLMAVLNKRQ